MVPGGYGESEKQKSINCHPRILKWHFRTLKCHFSRLKRHLANVVTDVYRDTLLSPDERKHLDEIEP